MAAVIFDTVDLVHILVVFECTVAASADIVAVAAVLADTAAAVVEPVLSVAVAVVPVSAALVIPLWYQQSQIRQR